jgi:hypothetical protein
LTCPAERGPPIEVLQHLRQMLVKGVRQLLLELLFITHEAIMHCFGNRQ